MDFTNEEINAIVKTIPILLQETENQETDFIVFLMSEFQSEQLLREKGLHNLIEVPDDCLEILGDLCLEIVGLGEVYPKILNEMELRGLLF